MPLLSLQCKAYVSELLDTNNKNVQKKVKLNFLAFYFYVLAIGKANPSVPKLAKKIADKVIDNLSTKPNPDVKKELATLLTQSLIAWVPNKDFFQNLFDNNTYYADKAESIVKHNIIWLISRHAHYLNARVNDEEQIRNNDRILQKYNEKLKNLPVKPLNKNQRNQVRKEYNNKILTASIVFWTTLAVLSALSVEISGAVIFFAIIGALLAGAAQDSYATYHERDQKFWKESISLEILPAIKKEPKKKLTQTSQAHVSASLEYHQDKASPSSTFDFPSQPIATQEVVICLTLSSSLVIDRPRDKIGTTLRGKIKADERNSKQQVQLTNNCEEKEDSLPVPGAIGAQFATLPPSCLVRLTSRQLGENANLYGIWNEPLIRNSGNFAENDRRYQTLFDVFSRGKMVGEVGTGIKRTTMGFFEVKHRNTPARVVGENEFQNANGTALEFTTFMPHGFH